MSKKKWSLSAIGEERQREKLAARPPEIDFRAALAIAVQKLTDIMDDKYLALNDDICDVRRILRQVHSPWLRRVYLHIRRWFFQPVYDDEYDDD